MIEMTGEKKLAHVRAADRVERRNVEAIARMEEAAKAERNVGDRVADAVATFCGSMTFVWIHAVLFLLWIVANTLPFSHHFDPFPFQFLTLVVSLEAIFLTTFVMVSQNRQQVIADRRNHLDLQINLLSEQENSRMLQMLTSIAQKMDIPCGDDEDLQEFVAATEPERIVEEIRERIEQRTPFSES